MLLNFWKIVFTTAKKEINNKIEQHLHQNLLSLSMNKSELINLSLFLADIISN